MTPQPIPAAYLTTYDALVCGECAEGRADTPVTAADLEDVYGYDSARCEECGVVLFDGVRHADRTFGV